MKTLFFIRWMQFLDIYKRYGFRKKLEIFILSIAGLIILLISINRAPYIFYSFPILISIILQINRKDYDLLKKTGLTLHAIFSFEYLMLSVPFLTIAMFQKRFEYVLFLILFLIILPIVNSKSKKIL